MQEAEGTSEGNPRLKTWDLDKDTSYKSAARLDMNLLFIGGL
jgi:hypothetical protein